MSHLGSFGHEVLPRALLVANQRLLALGPVGPQQIAQKRRAFAHKPVGHKCVGIRKNGRVPLGPVCVARNNLTLFDGVPGVMGLDLDVFARTGVLQSKRVCVIGVYLIGIRMIARSSRATFEESLLYWGLRKWRKNVNEVFKGRSVLHSKMGLHNWDLSSWRQSDHEVFPRTGALHSKRVCVTGV